jgi:hypothetical protein
MAGGKTALWVIGAIVGVSLLCCGGISFGVFNWFRGSMAEAETHSPFVTQLLTEMSNANYEFEPVSKYFDNEVYKGLELEKFKVFLRAYRENLGKFENLGSANGFFTESSNGTTLNRYTFDVIFEKSKGTVSVVFKDGDYSKVAGFAIVSPALK